MPKQNEPTSTGINIKNMVNILKEEVDLKMKSNKAEEFVVHDSKL